MSDRVSGLFFSTVGILLGAWIGVQGARHDEVLTALVGGLLLGSGIYLAVTLLAESPMGSRHDRDRKP
jgi:ABC-type dipeptide/oligopeptide/nickel transport system permease subunit